MCGLTGVLALDRTPLNVERLKPMVDVIAHRGPDDAGYLVWQTGRLRPDGQAYGQAFTDSRFRLVNPLLPLIDSDAGRQMLAEEPWDLFLGHRRLAILDLSVRGHQPLGDKAGALWLAYNGEIYNFRELRAELTGLGHSFAGQSDTEVLLQAWARWGAGCVPKLNGMFAFALWDGRVKKLHLVRDRYGIKPLYLYRNGSALAFASEIKSILAYRPEPPRVDLLALNEYFSFQNTFSGRTLFEHIRLLPPATIVTVDPAAAAVREERYWDFDFRRPSAASEAELREELGRLIGQAVKRQLVSDVPIGSYLSGGLDSGTITALATRDLGRICTFTAGFDLSEAAAHELQYDERELAEHMASVFQTQHYECVLHAGDLAAALDKLVWHQEDLRVGQSYPNWYVAGLAGRFVKVVLSGAGGDELFGGYPWRYAAALGEPGSDFVQNYYRYWQRLVSNRNKLALYRPEIAERLRGLEDEGAIPFRDETISVFRRVLGGGVDAATPEEQVNWALYFECKTFLHGLLLVEDKLSMAHSLETRVPLLDNDLVDFACRVPIHLKVPGLRELGLLDENLLEEKIRYKERMQVGKNILRQAMERHLPAGILNARKQGFSAPDESWFRGRCENYVRERLLANDSRIGEYFEPAFVRGSLDRHARGEENNRLLIWSYLCFETWLRTFQAEI